MNEREIHVFYYYTKLIKEDLENGYFNKHENPEKEALKLILKRLKETEDEMGCKND